MSMNESERGRPRGRPPSEAVRRSVFEEVLRLVELTPPDSITRRAVADGAGVSRQTLYNRWETTADIVLDALLERAERTIGAEGSGDLRTYLVELAAAVNGWARPGLRAVAAYVQSDAAFAARFRSDFLAARHGALRTVIADAAPGLDAALLAELIAGSMWYRVLIEDAELDAEWVDAMTSLVDRPV